MGLKFSCLNFEYLHFTTPPICVRRFIWKIVSGISSLNDCIIFFHVWCLIQKYQIPKPQKEKKGLDKVILPCYPTWIPKLMGFKKGLISPFSKSPLSFWRPCLQWPPVQIRPFGSWLGGRDVVKQGGLIVGLIRGNQWLISPLNKAMIWGGVGWLAKIPTNWPLLEKIKSPLFLERFGRHHPKKKGFRWWCFGKHPVFCDVYARGNMKISNPGSGLAWDFFWQRYNWGGFIVGVSLHVTS